MAVVIPPPTGLSLGAVEAAVCILVPVPGRAQVVILLLIVSKFDLLGAELHSITKSHGVSKGRAGGIELPQSQAVAVPWTNLCEEPFV